MAIVNTKPSEVGDHAFAITPHDVNDLAYVAKVWVGGAGAVKVDTAGGETVTISAAPAGHNLPMRCTRVYSTGTAATSLIGWY